MKDAQRTPIIAVFPKMFMPLINGPLFATFLLGMFWKRATGHVAFWVLLRAHLPQRLLTDSPWPKGKVDDH